MGFVARVSALCVIVLVTLAGCVGGAQPMSPVQPTPVPLGIAVEFNLKNVEGDFGSYLIQLGQKWPLTIPVRFYGSGSLVVQYPATPHALFSGDLVVEPMPGYEAQVEAQLNSGVVVLEGGASLQMPGEAPPGSELGDPPTGG